MDELRVRCNDIRSLLDDELEWCEHREQQFCRKRLAKKLFEIALYLNEHTKKISKSRRKLFYVKLVSEAVPKFSQSLQSLWLELRIEKEFRPLWLDRSNPSERGGIQYAPNGEMFGQGEAEWRNLFNGSRLDELEKKIVDLAKLSRKGVKSAHVEPAILFAHGRPS